MLCSPGWPSKHQQTSEMPAAAAGDPLHVRGTSSIWRGGQEQWVLFAWGCGLPSAPQHRAQEGTLAVAEGSCAPPVRQAGKAHNFSWLPLRQFWASRAWEKPCAFPAPRAGDTRLRWFPGHCVGEAEDNLCPHANSAHCSCTPCYTLDAHLTTHDAESHG